MCRRTYFVEQNKSLLKNFFLMFHIYILTVVIVYIGQNSQTISIHPNKNKTTQVNNLIIFIRKKIFIIFS